MPHNPGYIESWSQAVDIGYWFFTYTKIGTEVNLFAEPPSEREEPPDIVKLFCRILFFFCAIIDWFRERILDAKRFEVDDDSGIKIHITCNYYDKAGRFLTFVSTRCSGENHCECYLKRLTLGRVDYPELPPGVFVYGVRSISKITIYGQVFEHETWETDGATPDPIWGQGP